MQNLQTVGSTGFFRQEKRFYVLANNLSNIQTAGFKKDVPVFQEILSRSGERYKTAEIEASTTVFRQGDLQRTGNDLDLAIDGEGFFQVKTPAGIRYTRNGNLRLNREKVLIQADGFPVMGRRGEIILNGNKIVVEPGGAIRADGHEVDKIMLATFPDTRLLKKEGNNLFASSAPLDERKDDKSKILQGALELSNVNPMEEMIMLIDSLRSFDASSRVIKAKDELDGKAVNELGKV
ncbi:MAG: flagellar basal-body rod protein FlgF [Deltaproteobacteria bacterium]|nr:flagellar basal-body rod protein FlgF [Deltaproteobacteria bacterium]